MRRLVVLVLLLAACGGSSASDEAPAPGSNEPAPTTPVPSTALAPTTTPAPATTLPPASTTTTPTTSTTDSTTTTAAAGPPSSAPTSSTTLTDTLTFDGGLAADVYAPAEPGPWPVAITIHGGGWFAGDRAATAPLAEGLAGRGVVVFNIEYRTVLRGGSFPGTVDDIACALTLVQARAGDYTTGTGGVTLIGHSAGAHLGALVALAPGEFGAGCAEGPPAAAAGFIGLAGPYNTDLFDFLLAPFFGTRRDQDPEPWARGNPLTYAGASPDVRILLFHGDADQVIPPAFSEELAAALIDTGHPVDLEILDGATHAAAMDPRVVGDAIAEWLKSS